MVGFVYKVERLERLQSVPLIICGWIILTGLFVHTLENYFQVYDYVIWGSGKLTRFLIQKLPGKKLWVIPTSKNFHHTMIKNIETGAIISSYQNFFNDEDIYFPNFDIPDLENIYQLTKIQREIIYSESQKLIKTFGHMFPGVYYHHFDGAMEADNHLKIIERPEILSESKQVIRFTDNTFVLGKKLIFADTCHLENLKNWFGRTQHFELRVLGYQDSIEPLSAPNKIIFGDNYRIENGVRRTFRDFEFAHGRFDQLTYVQGQGKLFNFSVPLVRGSSVICLDPSVLFPSQHWVRNYLLLASLAKYF